MSEQDEEVFEEEPEYFSDSEQYEEIHVQEVAEHRFAGNPWALVLTGFASFFIGFVLSMGPKLSWKLGQISEGFAHLGVSGGTLIMGGMLLIGLGMAWRSLLSHEPAPQPRPESDFAIDQVASDLNEVRTAMLEYGDQLRAFKKALERMHSNIGALPEKLQHALPDPSASTGPDPDAIFRMAASLDKLWARFDEKLDQQHEATKSDIGKLQSSLDATDAALGVLAKSKAAPDPVPSSGNIHDELGMLDDVHGPVPGSQSAKPTSGTAFYAAPQATQQPISAGHGLPGQNPVPAAQPPVDPGNGPSGLSILDDEQVDNALRNMRRNAE